MESLNHYFAEGFELIKWYSNKHFPTDILYTNKELVLATK